RAKTGAHRLERRAGVPDLRVTIHTSLGGRDVGKAAGFYRGVTIPAVDADTSNVVRVAERHRLFPRLSSARRVIGSAEFGKDPGQKAHHEEGAKDGDPRKRVGAVMKD